MQLQSKLSKNRPQKTRQRWLQLTAFEGVDGAASIGNHLIRTGETGRLSGARLIAADIARYAQLPCGTVV